MLRGYAGRAVGRAGVSLAIALALSSCSSRIRAYPGEALPRERVAVLKPQSSSSSSVYFVRVDDTTFSKPKYSDVEVLPGAHEVEFGFEAIGYQSFGQTITRSWSTQNLRAAFDVEAGHEYGVGIQQFGTAAVSLGQSHTGQWIGYVVDLSSGQTVYPKRP